jgi:Fe2+ or Zn2+ uptake regulation protein
MARYSPQRELILSILHDTKEHPSAAIVYEKARAVMPNISLGTVYRNLESLSADGEIQSFEFLDISHFDGESHPHPHFCCTECKSVSDLNCDMKKVEGLIKELSEYDITHESLLFYGVCRNCKSKKAI